MGRTKKPLNQQHPRPDLQNMARVMLEMTSPEGIQGKKWLHAGSAGHDTLVRIHAHDNADGAGG
jgi:hypothetical protein